MTRYGLTKDDLKLINQKIETQRKYLNDTEFITNSGQIKTLLDVSFSANHSERYYAQLANKINTLTDYAKLLNLDSAFCTITLDGFYRDLHKGDYSRFDKFSDHKKKLILRYVPNDDDRGYLRDKINNREVLDIKDLYNILNYQMQRFIRSYTFKKLRQEDQQYIYIKTTEPHKDGIPHMHMMFFVPSHFMQAIEKSFYNNFTAKQIKFETDIKNPAGYVLKYITKSFLDVKNKKELDYLQAWYIKHRIIRCTTSKTVIPQWVYQKLYSMESDWYYLSTECMGEWSKEDDYFRFEDSYYNLVFEYDKGVYSKYCKGVLISQYGQKKEESNYKPPQLTLKSEIKKQRTYINVDIDGENYRYHTYYDELYKPVKAVSYENMTGLDLFDAYNNFDIENEDIAKFAVLKNKLIERGLLDDELLSISDYTNDIEFGF